MLGQIFFSENMKFGNVLYWHSSIWSFLLKIKVFSPITGEQNISVFLDFSVTLSESAPELLFLEGPMILLLPAVAILVKRILILTTVFWGFLRNSSYMGYSFLNMRREGFFKDFKGGACYCHLIRQNENLIEES